MRNCSTYYHVKNSKKRIVVNQGGSRSGKTYSIMQLLIELCYFNKNKGLVITICRKTLPAIRGSVLRDFVEILTNEGWYSDSDFNKSELTYTLFGNLIEFISIDQSQKIRGRKRNILFINEANEIDFESWVQLVLRTTGKIIIDYNPSDEFSYIYDKVITRDDCDFFKTTYKDNPYLAASLVDEIERLQDADENHWRVFGLGERGVSSTTIYTHWLEIDEMPSDVDYCYGLDFGFNHPNALIKVGHRDEKIYWEQKIYRSGMTTNDLIKEMNDLGIDKRKEIWADAAGADKIEEIARAGYNIRPADKSVIDGINEVKTRPLYIVKSSGDVLKEIRNYKWKTDKQGRKLDEPVKFMDDGLDAGRYGTYNYFLTRRVMSGRYRTRAIR